MKLLIIFTQMKNRKKLAKKKRVIKKNQMKIIRIKTNKIKTCYIGSVIQCRLQSIE